MGATLTGSDVTERLTEIDRRRREIWKRQSEVKDKLGLEQNRLLTDEANRKGNLELLAGADDDAMRGYLGNEIDELDKRIAAHRRMIEAYNGAIVKIDAELKIVTDQLAALNKEVEAAEREEAFQEWQKLYEQACKDAVTALDAARIALARLARLGNKAEYFDTPTFRRGSQIADIVISEFFREVQPGNRGFEPVSGRNAHDLRFDIFPAARKTDLGLL